MPTVRWFSASFAILLAMVSLVFGQFPAHAASVAAVTCRLRVPDQPLTAKGLATPYRLLGCDEADSNASAFVQAGILDLETGQLAVYSPLIVTGDQTPAVPPVVPTLPKRSIVAIWFGFNGDVLTLDGDVDQCVNGLDESPFGQFSYCNARAFFEAAGKLVQPPTLGMALDGKPCPTVRDFSVVDQDQSDNVQTTYLLTIQGMAQDTALNRAMFPGATVLKNPSDNRLLTNFIDPALGCTPWLVPDLANPGHMAPSLAANELQAARWQRAPRAYVPLTDPMVLVNGEPNHHKADLYRYGVDQPSVEDGNASGKTYCRNLVKVGAPRLVEDQPYTSAKPAPFPTANSLYTWMGQRFQASYDLLGCGDLLHKANPVTTTLDKGGVVVDVHWSL